MNQKHIFQVVKNVKSCPQKNTDSNILLEPHLELFGSFALHLGEVTLGKNQHPENKSNVYNYSPNLQQKKS
jgi:hypothetical protein